MPAAAGTTCASQDATRGGEWREGIARLASRRRSRRTFGDILTCQSPHAAGATPTHIRLADARAAKPARRDRIVLVEQQPAEAQASNSPVAADAASSVVCGDGYAALHTYLPPRKIAAWC